MRQCCAGSQHRQPLRLAVVTAHADLTTHTESKVAANCLKPPRHTTSESRAAATANYDDRCDALCGGCTRAPRIKCGSKP